MSNVIADFGVSGSFPAAVGGAGTAIKYFPRLLGPSIGVAPSTPSATNAAGQLVLPAFNELNGQLFKVKIVGDVLDFTAGTTYNVVLYANTGTVATPVYTALASTGAVGAANTARAAFALDVNIFGSSLSGTTAGLLGGYYNSVTITPAGVQTMKAQAALDASLTGINFNNGGQVQGVVGLVVGVTFATSVAQNAANLYQFQIEA